ncbi:MAG: hypothetical protein J6127_01790 [Clostridiales bacterium]|nr:hypothetical protein [Clostridiales bacterium]
MLSRNDVLKFTIEGIIIAVLSFFVLLMGILSTRGMEYDRMQETYRNEFTEVLRADSYQEVVSPLIAGYSGIDAVYEGVDANGAPIGYVFEIEVTDHGTGNPLKLLIGIDYNTAQLTGMTRARNDDYTSSITDEDISVILEQTIHRQIPVSYGTEGDSTDADTADMPRLADLNDGVYYAQTLGDDASGYIDYVEMTVENGVITLVQWDAFNTDMNIKNRRQSSLDGVYSVQGLNWASQSYILCHALMDVQNPDLLAMKSDGTTDIIDGVTVNIRTFYNLCVECIENSRAGFDKDDYFAGLQEVVEGLFEGDFESLGVVNDDGFIVFSFDDYPSVFLNPEGGYLNLRQRVTGDMTDYSDFDSSSVEGGEELAVTAIGSEDGVRTGDSTFDADSIDGLPMSEINTFIDGIPDHFMRTSDIVTAINTSYKFLKDYLNWMA